MIRNAERYSESIFHGEAPRGPRRNRGAALLLVLIIVGVIFVIGMGAITAATRDTHSGRNFAAYAVALQAAQSGVEVARRRLAHPWDVGYDFGEDWPGTGGFDALPAPTDGNGARMDAWYNIGVASTEDEHTVTVTGRAVVPGGSPGDAADVLAERTVEAVFERPGIEIPYAVLTGGDFTIPHNTEVRGDVFCNGDLLIQFGARVTGNAYATGAITNFGVVGGGTFPNQEPVDLPPVRYYGYRPSYDYGGLDNDAIELSGSVLADDPPTGMPNNPNNVFYYEGDNLTVCHDVDFDPGTLITKHDVTFQGEVDIVASEGFPSLIVNDDIQLASPASLRTRGMIHLRDDIKPSGDWEEEDGDEEDGGEEDGETGTELRHRGPLVVQSGGGISTALDYVLITYRADRVSYQPINNMVLPLPMLSYTESP